MPSHREDTCLLKASCDGQQQPDGHGVPAPYAQPCARSRHRQPPERPPVAEERAWPVIAAPPAHPLRHATLEA